MKHLCNLLVCSATLTSHTAIN